MREAATLCLQLCHEGARLSHVLWQHEVRQQGRVAGVAARTGPSRGEGTRGGGEGGGGQPRVAAVVEGAGWRVEAVAAVHQQFMPKTATVRLTKYKWPMR